MRSLFLKYVLLAVSLILITSCQTKQQEGAVEGAVVPPRPGARVVVSRSGNTVSAVDADTHTGAFRIALAPGEYDVRISAPASQLPVIFPGVTVAPGKTAQLPPIDIAQATGTSSISGTVLPASADTKITLFYEGQERASINASPAGRYEFTALPSGSYTVLASAPGYADDKTELHIADGRSISQNMRVLYVTPISGIDWEHAAIHATGRGVYPANASNPTAMHEMAKRAALSEAERNLILIVQQIKLDPKHDLKSLMVGGAFTVRIRGFLQGFKIIEEREVDSGIEVVLELPLTGPSGLTRQISDSLTRN
jgi:Carboxypeptidase regulatory-like domain